MHQSVYPERRTRGRHRRAEAANSVDVFEPREASGDRRLAHYAPPPGSVVDRAYERFLGLPVPAVLAALWLSGAALVGSAVLLLYVLGTTLASAVGGA